MRPHRVPYERHLRCPQSITEGFEVEVEGPNLQRIRKVAVSVTSKVHCNQVVILCPARRQMVPPVGIGAAAMQQNHRTGLGRSPLQQMKLDARFARRAEFFGNPFHAARRLACASVFGGTDISNEACPGGLFRIIRPPDLTVFGRSETGWAPRADGQKCRNRLPGGVSVRFSIDSGCETLMIAPNQRVLSTLWGTGPLKTPMSGVECGLAIERERSMAARKKKARRAKKPVELIISKARVKNAVKKCNVGSEFYEALDGAVRELIKGAEGRAVGNKRKTLKAVDL